MLYDKLPGAPRPKHTPYSDDHAEYETTARRLVSEGQLLSAIEVIRDGIKRFGSTPVLQQQLALALAQTGALDSARDVLDGLLTEAAATGTPPEGETLSLYGRVYKEMWRRAPEPAGATKALQEAMASYRSAFELAGDDPKAAYPGINLAFTLLAAGKSAEALECAARVEALCHKALKVSSNQDDGWLHATLAEALLHQGNTADAAAHYTKAAQLFTGRWRDLISMRRQAREIIQFREKPWQGPPPRWYSLVAMRARAREFLGRSEKGQDWLDRCFAFPTVVTFTGHMIDRPDRPTPRFPAEREGAVRDAIRSYLKSVRPGFGYAAAASGADLIFCECLLELGGKLHLVLPCAIEAFKRQSVTPAGPEWEKRFHAVLGQASSLLVATPPDFSDRETDPEVTPPIGFVYASRVLTGLAVLHARSLDFEIKALALWDGQPGDNVGGTASVVADWVRRNLDYHVIRPDLARWVPPPPDAPLPPAPEAVVANLAPTERLDPSVDDGLDPSLTHFGGPVGSVQHVIKSVVSAEIVAFQKIGELHLPAFISIFKGAIGELLAEANPAPVVNEAWLKAHTFVFDDLRPAAEFALLLRDRIASTPWKERGLPADLGLRVVLHAGPMFSFHDPATQRHTCMGTHVERAAYLEPITPPGQVYATQEFAALCSAEDMPMIGFEFLGRIRTAKLFEEAPLYRLDWKHVSAAGTAAETK